MLLVASSQSLVDFWRAVEAERSVIRLVGSFNDLTTTALGFQQFYHDFILLSHYFYPRIIFYLLYTGDRSKST